MRQGRNYQSAEFICCPSALHRKILDTTVVFGVAHNCRTPVSEAHTYPRRGFFKGYSERLWTSHSSRKVFRVVR